MRLPATLRAIEAGKRLPVIWDVNLPGKTDRHAVVGAAWAEIEVGGFVVAAEIEPSRSADGYEWAIVSVSDEVLLHGVAATMDDAQACAAVAAVAVLADIAATS
ncbi:MULTISPECIES: hypothetical protein [unclassified Aureimonas]|uniref:hypothetical protein n=1 Tax=unclassified Aureimonas TaxID=2615206 RepID=UPI0006F38E24|nr:MULTISPECIES: hypothetical protein [unclassified Aureimonas]KQT64154.1 hypothetical protein ASG62_03925 [Aureimonas sp. Leaf427]KQT81343.1 hypothetical protein ASG54_01195 [Aureimonas sp. Leaf460]